MRIYAANYIRVDTRLSDEGAIWPKMANCAVYVFAPKSVAGILSPPYRRT